VVVGLVLERVLGRPAELSGERRVDDVVREVLIAWAVELGVGQDDVLGDRERDGPHRRVGRSEQGLLCDPVDGPLGRGVPLALEVPPRALEPQRCEAWIADEILGTRESRGPVLAIEDRDSQGGAQERVEPHQLVREPVHVRDDHQIELALRQVIADPRSHDGWIRSAPVQREAPAVEAAAELVRVGAVDVLGLREVDDAIAQQRLEAVEDSIGEVVLAVGAQEEDPRGPGHAGRSASRSRYQA